MDILFARPPFQSNRGIVPQIILAEFPYRVADDAVRDAKGLEEVLAETVIRVRCPQTVPVGDHNDTCRSCQRDTRKTFPVLVSVPVTREKEKREVAAGAHGRNDKADKRTTTNKPGNKGSNRPERASQGPVGRTSGLHQQSTPRQGCLSWPCLGPSEHVSCQTAQTPTLEASQRDLAEHVLVQTAQTPTFGQWNSAKRLVTKPPFPKGDVDWQKGLATPNRLTRSRACTVPK